MAILINQDCIVCYSCLPECPNNAIYEPGEQWAYSDGTSLKTVELENGARIDASTKHDPITGGAEGADGNEYYFIVPSKCTECTGFHEEPACALVCPTDACVPDPDYIETKDELLLKKEWLHHE